MPHQFQFVKILFILNILLAAISAKLTHVSPDELISLAKSNELLLALFDDANCKLCKHATIELAKVTEQLSGLADVETVQTSSAYLTDSGYAIKWMGSPVIFLFRENTPVLYDGAVNAEQIAEWIIHSMRHSSVQTLTDDTFEHLTQAASGATTGDWFILFVDTESSSHRAFSPIWESVGARLKGKLNVATVDITRNPNVVKRFQLEKFPAFIFFRFRKMHRYTIEKLDVASLVAFASGWYKNTKAEAVPGVPTPFDDLTEYIAVYLKNNSWVAFCGVAIIILITAVIALVTLNSKKQDSQTKRD